MPCDVQDSSARVLSVCIALIAFVFASPATAEQGKLHERLTPEVMAVVYPGAERLGMEEGSPPAIAVFKGDTDCRLCVFDPRHHRRAGVFDDAVRRHRRRRSQRPHHGGQGRLPPGVDDRSRSGAPAPARYVSCPRSRQAAARRHQRAAAGLRRWCNHQRARHARRRPHHRGAGAARARRADPCADC